MGQESVHYHYHQCARCGLGWDCACGSIPSVRDVCGSCADDLRAEADADELSKREATAG